MKHEEKKKDEDEGPKFDERGEPLVIFKRTCPAMNNADLEFGAGAASHR